MGRFIEKIKKKEGTNSPKELVNYIVGKKSAI
jgi:hypothetical protein